jgi:hypothetical protein
MASHIGRRKFLATLGGAAAWPLAARAQQPAMPVAGFLRSTTAASAAHLAAAFRQGLNETGFVEGQNVAIDYRWADNQNDRLPGLVAEMVRRRVDSRYKRSQGCKQYADRLRSRRRSGANRPRLQPQPSGLTRADEVIE